MELHLGKDFDFYSDLAGSCMFWRCWWLLAVFLAPSFAAGGPAGWEWSPLSNLFRLAPTYPAFHTMLRPKLVVLHVLPLPPQGCGGCCFNSLSAPAVA